MGNIFSLGGLWCRSPSKNLKVSSNSLRVIGLHVIGEKHKEIAALCGITRNRVDQIIDKRALVLAGCSGARKVYINHRVAQLELLNEYPQTFAALMEEK